MNNIIDLINEYPNYLKIQSIRNNTNNVKKVITLNRLLQEEHHNIFNFAFNFYQNFDYFIIDNKNKYIVTDDCDINYFLYCHLNKNTIIELKPDINFEYYNYWNCKLYQIEYTDIKDLILKLKKKDKDYSRLKRTTIIKFKYDQKITHIYNYTNNTITILADNDQLQMARDIAKFIVLPKIISTKDTIVSTENMTKQDCINILTELIKNNNLPETQEELFNYKYSAIYNEIAKSIDRVYNNKLDNVNNQLVNLLTQYNQLLETKETITLKRNAIKDRVKQYNNISYNSDYIEKIDIESDTYNDELRLTIWTKFMPILYTDYDLINSSIEKNYYGNLSDETKEAIKQVDGEKYFFGIYPMRIEMRLNLTSNCYNLKFKPGTVSYSNPTYNGHAIWNRGSGCLGTFGIPISDAAADLNINKLIALLIQYLQTIGPVDYAGQNTIIRPTILDWENRTIVFTAGRKCNTEF